MSDFRAEPELTEQPVPEPGPGEVLVRMNAAGLNPFDWKVIDGAIPDTVFPLIVGTDGAGTVERVGEGVTGVRPGDPVFGQFGDPRRGLGSYAERAVAREDAIAPPPRTIALSEAAAVPTAGTTALNLVDRVGDARRLLIVGATGGVGTFATQLAAARGITVVATATADKADLMRALGAAEIVDHTAGPVAERLAAPVDAVIDLVDDTAGLRELLPVVRPGGTVLSPVFAVPEEGLPGVDARNFLNEAGTERLERLAREIDAGNVRVLIGDTVTLPQAPDALARSRAGRARGKTVIVI
ncbi:NADP-dependent oxidoreductase [Actinoallomurus rhizosphaericola]|uniref:NADP-dependent oxidoreductase n=1 Tax=Actinoallomurus rhizosphaericola TaxID=2952536 RepID=UPI0020938A63|nr:NADP-dependent oxidoreductase [Actinoallomurus rhizosphaericola]MCO5998339.1 NADP-dependent oxidoreductase [Actinoallomurus rhizosphaericola]